MRFFGRTRPPFSNASGYPHRRLKNPSNGNDGPDGQQPGNSGDSIESDEEPVDLQPDENGENELPVEEPSEANAEDLENLEPTFELDELPPHVATLPGLRQNTPDLIIREFDSWNEFVETAARDDLYAWKSGIRNSHTGVRGNGSGHTGSGTDSFAEAVHLARTGWPEGRKLMSESLALIIPRPTPFRSQIYDVGGAFPVIPIAIAGDPACMVDFFNSDIAARPIVRIDQNIRANWNVLPSEMMTHGAAVLSLVSDLEARGYSVELRIFENNFGQLAAPHLIWSAIYKRAGENLDLDRAAFALAHPSVLRRFGFTMREQSPELERGYKDAYGYEVDTPIDPTVITIPPVKKGETPDQAREIVRKAAEDFLNDANLENAA